MNAERRKQIQSIIDSFNELKGRVETLQEEEQSAYDNMPEGLQQSEKGQLIDDASNALTSAVEGIDEVISDLEESIQ